MTRSTTPRMTFAQEIDMNALTPTRPAAPSDFCGRCTGAATARTLPLVLPTGRVYDVVAQLNAIQVAVDPTWVNLATYGSLGAGTSPNFNSPAQLAKDSSGNIYVADTANARLVTLNSSGAYVTSITSLTGIKGVCVDSSDNVYVCYNPSAGDSTIKKYNSSLVLQATAGFTSGGFSFVHIATDGTNVYVTDAGNNKIRRNPVSLGLGTSWGSAGSGNGQFSSPWGICVYGSEVYVVDAGNNRVQVSDTSGTYQRQWTIAPSSRGIAPDGASHLVVAEYGSDLVHRYSTTGTSIDSFSQTDPDGVVVASGDVIWVSNVGSHNVAKWDEMPNYGALAIAIGGDVSPFMTAGPRVSAIMNAHTAVVDGPESLAVQVIGKALSGQATWQAVVLSVTATPR